MAAKKQRVNATAGALVSIFLFSFFRVFLQTMVFFVGIGFFVPDAFRNASPIGFAGVPFAVLGFALVVYRPSSLWRIIKSFVS